ncbi:MAG: T9SS type A sorting domain-containing protein [Tannerella sp.]|nr:T9SS type A sorting domain-containing protein [Tannerella sp.]
MKKGWFVLLVMLTPYLSAQTTFDFVNKGYYELTVDYNVHNGTDHAASCSSQIWIKAYFQNGGIEQIFQQGIRTSEKASTPGKFIYIFPADKRISQLEIWTERDYTSGTFVPDCENGDEGTTWVNDITYPVFTKYIQGMPGYDYSRSYMDISIVPLTNKNLLELSFFVSSNSYSILWYYKGWASYFGETNRIDIGTNHPVIIFGWIANSTAGNKIYFSHDATKTISDIGISLYISARDQKGPYDLQWDQSIPGLDMDQTIYEETIYEETDTKPLPIFSGLNPPSLTFPEIPSSKLTYDIQVTVDYNNVRAPIYSNNSILSTDKSITLTAKGDYPSSSHHWQVCFDNDIHPESEWKSIDIPLTDSRNEISFTGRDLLGNNYALLNKKIHFRYYIGDKYRNWCSQIASVTYKKDAPKISLYQVNGPSCAYTHDGSITLQLSRDLDADEIVDFVVYKSGESDYVDGNKTNVGKLEADRCYTIGPLSAGTYQIKISGKQNGNAEMSDGAGYIIDNIIINSPQPVNLSYLSFPVNCHGGSDGRITVQGSGGTGSYYSVYKRVGADNDTTPQFGAEGYTIGSLSPDSYTLRLYDSNGCQVRNGQGTEKTETISISQPAYPLTVAVERIFQPRGWGFADGWIKVRAQGGTMPYTFTWTDGNAGDIAEHTSVEENGSMTNTVSNLGDGHYYLRMTDSRYPGADANDRAGCVAELDTVLVQPPPLVVEPAIYDSISCFGRNDGALVAHARGGVGGPGTYRYQWDTPVSLTGFVADSIFRDLPAALYRVTVRDTNGITAGAELYFPQPDLLTAAIHSNTLACDGDADGWIEALVAGGTTPYRYAWTGIGTEQASTAIRIDGLTGGAYALFVRDRRQCEAIATGRILVPGGMEDRAVVIPPLCRDVAGGSIALNMKGGVAPYSYVWNTSAVTSGLTDIPAGSYSVRITDANGCFIDRQFDLPNPEPLSVRLGEDMVLCRGQSALLSAAVADPHASYRWYNRYGLFSEEAETEVSGSDAYRVVVTDGNGCSGADTITVSESDREISADFVAAAKAAATVPACFVNISRPAPESVEWLLPDDPSVLVTRETPEELEVVFGREGAYTVGLLSTVGACRQAVYKTVTVVNKYDLTEYEPQQEAFLKQFKLYPNPAAGQFTVLIELSEAAEIQLRLVSVSGAVAETKPLSGSDRYEEVFTHRQAGAYILQLVSPKAVAAIHVVIEN